MRTLVTIGRFSELAQLTIKALRLYDKLGLLRPAVVDFPSGFRYYSLDQVAIAERIRLLRSLDMPLDEIRALLTADDPDAARRHLARHRQRLEGRIVDYQQALTRLDDFDAGYKTTRKGQPMERTVYRCSLCGKNHMLARHFLTGPAGIHLCDECVWAADERVVAGPPLRCALCGADTSRHYRAQSGPDEIGLCLDCLTLCKEMVGTEATTYCSFCDKSQHDVQYLIAGPHDVFICDVCVASGSATTVRPPSARCSFCGKAYGEVQCRRTGARDASICNDCAALCAGMIVAEMASPPS